MPVLGVIPARLGSTRLPRKPLQLIGGVPLVVRVAQRATEAGIADALVVATDSEEIANVVRAAGVSAVLTRPEHESGTDRVAEVARRAEYVGFDIVVNIQGDEPFLSAAALAGSVDMVRAGFDIGTAAGTVMGEAALSPSLVKVVCSENGRALYFSRAAIPFHRDAGSAGARRYHQHIGVYACTRKALLEWAALPPTPLELTERLEQLRALEHGLSIGVTLLEETALPGVDTQEDLERADAHWTATARGFA
jgi:3-deoxy-manno-octulosonate cytidylyltransferase (CMP-KDO synthetase)